MVTWIGAAVAMFAIALAGSALLTLQLVRKAEADYPPAGGSVDVEGVRLHYLDRGQGRPVILIHGLRGSAYDFEVSISEGLARDHRVIAFDRPGNGYSDKLPDDRQSLFVEARQLHAAALKLGLKRPLIVGYSLGAAVAIAYADAYPEDVAGVVTIAGHVMPCRVPVGLLAFFAKRPLIAGVTSNTLLVPVGRMVGRMLLKRACSPQPMPSSYAKAALAMALRPRTFRYAPEELCRAPTSFACWLGAMAGSRCTSPCSWAAETPSRARTRPGTSMSVSPGRHSSWCPTAVMRCTRPIRMSS